MCVKCASHDAFGVCALCNALFLMCCRAHDSTDGAAAAPPCTDSVAHVDTCARRWPVPLADGVAVVPHCQYHCVDETCAAKRRCADVRTSVGGDRLAAGVSRAVCSSTL